MEGGKNQFWRWYRNWFDRVHDVAFHIVRDPSISAEVTRDVFIDAWHDLDRGADEMTGGRLLRNARTRALNRLTYDRRDRKNHPDAAFDRRTPGIDASNVRIDLDRRHRVLLAVSSTLGNRDASILSLHLRDGLDATELADELGVSCDDAPPVLARLRTGLNDAIAAWTCWNDGAPVCPELRNLVERGRMSDFDRATAKAVITHVHWCDACTAQHRRGAPPEEVYAGVPVLIAPETLRHDVTIALERSGILIPAAGALADEAPIAGSSPPGASTPEPELPVVADRSSGRRTQQTVLAVGLASLLLALLFIALRVGLG